MIPPCPPLTHVQLELLHALYTETTMADVARVTGWSPRHCRRLVNHLLATMNVATPIQAVAIAVANGHIIPNGRQASAHDHTGGNADVQIG